MAINRPTINGRIVSPLQVQKPDALRTLLVVQKQNTGLQPLGLWADVGNSEDLATLLGPKSMAQQAVKAFKKINQQSPLDVYVLSDDGTGTFAAATVTFTGTAVRAGVVKIAVSSALSHTFSLTVLPSSTPTSLASAFAAVVNASTAPVTAAAAAGIVTLTYTHRGLEGNNESIRITPGSTGISVAATPFSGGSVNPTLPSLQALAGNVRYFCIACPETYLTSALISDLDLRYNQDNEILDGRVYQTKTDSHGNLVVWLDTQNSKSQVPILRRLVSNSTNQGAHSCEPSIKEASEFAALTTFRLTEGTDMTSIGQVNTGGLLDFIGGVAIASLPYHNLPVKVSRIPAQLDWSYQEQRDLEAGGGVFYGNNRTNTAVIIGAANTTYKFDSSGAQDPTFRSLPHVDMFSLYRELRVRNTREFTKSKRMTSGDLVDNRGIVTVDSYIQFQQSLQALLSGADYMLTIAGDDAMEEFLADLSVVFDVQEGKITDTSKFRGVGQVNSIDMIISAQIGPGNTFIV
jgi:phage tail sheath gpL-like